MLKKNIKLSLLLPFILFGFPAKAQIAEECQTVIQCAREIADMQAAFESRMLAMINSVAKAELPVGTVISSVLPPDKFLTNDNPQIDKKKWVYADGKTLPENTIYQRLSGDNFVPDLRLIEGQKIVLGIKTGYATNGQIVDHLKTDRIADEDWHFHFGLRDITGQKYNNDWEQAEDQHQVHADEGTLVASGRTFNFKHGRWGGWRPGTANYLGIATKDNPMFYYMKVN